ncbi:conserved membrane hypothetical protein [Frankia canadensis]|uniref:Uncharacterized protein n=1 Tax=Frankia canadensis TaxID=1836972 RepID=A0A2I2L013_9ACTN|nr:hypothetical protein [Frankia canadensis]SNQ51256.1 conserved membrane hypothetical protein [Frankia canadensis]SOU58546.1 conserved membrane hypothetical protein [Frankia canadensis]
MNLSLGVFDIFAYSVPGSLYLALLLFVLDQAGWADLGQIGDLNATLLIVGGILASYLLGHLTYAPRRFLGRRLPQWLHPGPGARQEFLDRYPPAQAMAFVRVDPAVVFAAVEVKAPDSAVEISRLRASGIALRNAGFAFLLAAVVALVELAAGPERGLVGFCVAAFLVGFVGATRAGHELSRWAALKTLEVALWIPDIEATLATMSPAPPQPPPPPPAPTGSP